MVQLSHFHYYQKQIQTNSKQVSSEMYQLLQERFSNYLKPQSDQEEHDTIRFLDNLVQSIVDHLFATSEDLQEVSDWGEKVGEEATKYSYHQSLSDYLTKFSVYKEALWTFIEKQTSGTHASFQNIIQVITQIDTIFNHFIHGFSQAYTKAEKQRIENYEEKYLKLSTPIVPIMDHVAILPVIGEIDEKRANVLIDETLREANNLDIEYLVIDLSGVYNVDELFMNHLQRLLDSLKILGLHPILTGMRPDLSMRAVQSGLNSGQNNDVLTKSSLKQAVQMLSE
ncbi:STAS domain-containing protein [Pontibacillus yanchengensis]|uniref:STAS domain-containing protein n=1 Tax=Pontibacillus yanchengensis Y32 TaxID=1385514 RepID=A0A0A2TJK0_9BACI|nr:STAS domain-containing protein [Pontibacillus yanchengensis]KGP74251.1 hypothetical protein N782_09190 [Pontibacillus yanchengensis Y32]